jgi:hypothetical protein
LKSKLEKKAEDQEKKAKEKEESSFSNILDAYQELDSGKITVKNL